MKLSRWVGCWLLCLWACAAWGAMASSRGFYGYGYAPSARTLPPGSLAYAFTVGPIAEVPAPSLDPGLQQHYTLMAFPLPWLELSAVGHQSAYEGSDKVDWHGELSGKIVLPKAEPWLPALAFGSYDAIQGGRVLEHLYFVGGFDWRAFDGGLALDLGAIYHRRRNPYDTASGPGTTSFVAAEADFGKVAFTVQNFWQGSRYGVAPGLSLKPFAHGPGPSWLELGGGVAWRAPSHTTDPGPWAGVQLAFPLASTPMPSDTASDAASSNTPSLWVDVNPVLDHSIGMGEYPVRGGVEQEGVAGSAKNGLYLVNALAFTASGDEERLVPRHTWDKSYVLYDSPSHGFRTNALGVGVPTLALGLLNTRLLGAQMWEELTLPGFVPACVQGGYAWGRAQGFNATLEMPLHPQGSGALDESQFYAEGGYYLGQHLGFMGVFRQGTARRHLRLSVGYDQDARQVLAEATARWSLGSSWQRTYKGMRARLSPNGEHRLSAPLYTYEYHAPFYVDGNSKRRLHGVPWVE